MEFIDLNPHGEIGSNCTFIKIGPFNLLIDAGLHPKKLGNDAMPDFNHINGCSIDCILLTHCHLDHLGSLPIITRDHPNVPVITTIPNKLLAPRMLRNSINVMKRQKEEKGIKELPLYVHKDIDHLKRALVTLPYGKSKFLHKDNESIEIKLHRAGHIVGACAIELTQNKKNIVLSGDVLFKPQRTLKGAKLPKGHINTLFLETTRGATKRQIGSSRESELERLIQSIQLIINRGGSCLIPVFALGRMQEILKVLFESMETGKLSKTPVYAKGLGMDVCNYFDKINQRNGLVDFNLKILKKLNVRAPEAKLRLGKNLKKKGIYLVSSGMMVERTPSYHIAASLLAHKVNGICFIGYCDPDTPGGKLIEQKNNETFFFEAFDYLSPILASIDKYDLSGHADRESLIKFAEKSNAKNIILNHGDNEARKWFKDVLRKSMPKTNLIDPDPCKLYSI